MTATERYDVYLTVTVYVICYVYIIYNGE